MPEFVTRKHREKTQGSTKEYGDIPLMCSYSLGRGKYCTGDLTKPGTHAPECPGYEALDPFVD